MVGISSYRFFTHDVEARATETLEIERALAAALDRDELLLHWQPQVELATGRIVGLEALVRWRRPEMGVQPAARFLPVAEERGLAVPIGEWVLVAACTAARRWQDAGLAPVRISVNLSQHELRQPRLARYIAEVAAGLGFDLALLDLELAEASLRPEPDHMTALLAEGIAFGLHLAIDNFGTGYSSLRQLRRLPIRKLKIDGSLVHGAPNDADAAAVTASIIELARLLGFTSVAECVETREELAFVRSRGCAEAQGDLFCAPVPTEEVEALLRRGALEPRG
jgi:EAL domain-containing protein (putative c-di-GMP-specific phosphodiesterase class I)